LASRYTFVKHTLFKADYRKRDGIEGTICQVVQPLQGRQTRYRGLAKSHFQSVALAAAINVTRGVNWLAENPDQIVAVCRFSPWTLISPTTSNP